LRAPNYFEEGQEYGTTPPTVGHWGNNYPSRIDTPNATFFGLSFQDMVTLATLDPSQMGGDMDELDDAGTYFDLGPRQTSIQGIHHYMCTRNNDFSNRDQKAKLVVGTSTAAFGYLGAAGGFVAADTGAAVYANQDALLGVVTISIVVSPPNSPSSFSGSVNSWYVTIAPLALPVAPGQSVTVKIPYDNKPLVLPKLYRTDDMLNGDWETVSGASFSGGVASASVTRGGTYVVQSPINWGAMVGIIVGGLAFVGLVVGGLYYKYRMPAGKDVKGVNSGV